MRIKGTVCTYILFQTRLDVFATFGHQMDDLLCFLSDSQQNVGSKVFASQGSKSTQAFATVPTNFFCLGQFESIMDWSVCHTSHPRSRMVFLCFTTYNILFLQQGIQFRPLACEKSALLLHGIE